MTDAREISRSRFAALTLLCCSALLIPGALSAATATVGQPVMGTILEVTVVADDEAAARELAQRCVDVARRWDDVLTTWRPDGELAKLNAAAGSGPQEVSAELRAALERMRALSVATGGVFDPAVGGIVEALRGSLNGRTPPVVNVPSARIADVLTFAGDRIALNAGARLDAGGIGKGIALDAMATELAARGADGWFLDFGGSSQLAHGRPETAPAWNVLIAGEARGAVHGYVRLQDASLSTSRAIPPGDPAGSIVDPRSSTVVAPPRLAVVLAADATTAEAWSKAVLILGRDGLEAARAAGVGAIYEDAAGVAMTTGFPLMKDVKAP